jgi:hypothetical protein
MDLDGDGDMDIVTANRVGNNLSILYNKGDGTFLPSRPFEAGGQNETACVAADANEDGILDLFVGAFGSKEMILLLGDGKGGLTFSTKVNCGGSPWMVAAGDMDGDGHVDVVAANAVEHNVAVIRGDGTGKLLPAETNPVGNFPLAIDLGDLDGDGDLDLVTSNYSSRNWTLYENSDNGKFINPRSLPARQAGSCAVFHDRDLDGDLDMTGVDEEADIIFLFENGGATAVHEAPSTDLPRDFSLAPAYPNPFAVAANALNHSEVTIPFMLRQAAKVNLRVVNVTGQTVAVLVDRVLPPGDHRAAFPARQYARGIYFYVMIVEGKTLIGKMAIF